MNKKVVKLLKKNRLFKKVFQINARRKRQKMYKHYYEQAVVQDKQIIFSAFQGRQYTCSPKAIYECMLHDPAFQDYTFIWALRDPNAKADYFDLSRTRLVKYNSAEFFQALYSSKYWVFNFKTPPYFYKRDSQVFLQCWHGTPLKRLGCDIEIAGNAATKLRAIHRSYVEDAKKYDLFLSPSRYCTEKFISAFGLGRLHKESIVKETGYPRNDFLLRYTPSDVQRVRALLGLPEGKKVILYAPTFRDDQFKPGLGHTYSLGLHLLRLREELSDDYVLLLRLHYLVSNYLDISQFRGFAYDVSQYDDVNDLYIASDMLITDYSSVFFDYANLRRPVLFYMYDLDAYQHEIRDFYIDLKELPGPILQDERALIEAIPRADAFFAEYRDKYDAFCKKYTYLDDGHAAEKAVKELMHCGR